MRDCQFQMRIVWSSEAETIHGYLFVLIGVGAVGWLVGWLLACLIDSSVSFVSAFAGLSSLCHSIRSITQPPPKKHALVVKLHGADVVKVAEQREEAAPQLVIPDLDLLVFCVCGFVGLWIEADQHQSI